MTQNRALSEILAALEIPGEIGADVLIGDVLALIECHHLDGHVSLYQAHSPGMSFLKRIGMITVASDIERTGYEDD